MAKKKPGDKLTHTFVKSVTEPGTYGDGPGGQGLRLLVNKRSKGGVSKTWGQRIRIGGKPVDLGLGSFPVVILTEARGKALDNQRRVSQGEDIRIPPPTVPTVAEAFEELIAARAPSWKGKKTDYSWHLMLDYCKEIRSTPVSEVTEDEVIKILSPMWQHKPKTARELRTSLSAIMHQAIRKGHRVVANPVPGKKELTRTLGKQPLPVHHKSLNYRQLGAALAQVRDADTWWGAKYCLIFIALTCVRSGEAREATWEEIDWSHSTWTIPASRMKKDIEHKVPLSTQAMELLAYVAEQSGRSQGVIFPPERGGQYMFASMLSKLLHRSRILFVPHGIRSSFRNWAGGRGREHLAQPVAGMVLAHKQSPEIELMYMTDDFFEHREPIMQDWADYLSETMGPVISTMPTQTEVQREKKESFRVQTYMVDPIGEAEYELIVQKVQESRTQGAPDQATLRGAVDVAAIALMRDGLLTPGDAVTARWLDLQREDDGTGRLTIPFSIKNKSGKNKSGKNKSGKNKSGKNKSGSGNVAYVSARTMNVIYEMRSIEHQLRIDATDERIFRLSADKLRLHIQKACEDAGLKGRFSGYSPRNGMAQDLGRSGASRIDLMRAKRWNIPASTDQSGRNNIATNGAVAQWYTQKQKEGAP